MRDIEIQLSSSQITSKSYKINIQKFRKHREIDFPFLFESRNLFVRDYSFANKSTFKTLKSNYNETRF